MRFPGKALVDLLGKPALEHIVDRIRAAGIDNIVLATTQCFIDMQIVKLARTLMVKSFMGDEYDPLHRMYKAALSVQADDVIRITHDCCLIDPDIIKKTVDFYFEQEADYCASRMDPTAYPDGMDVEIFKFDALKQAYELAEGEDRQHVTPWIKNIGIFKCVNIPSDTSGPEPKLCIDTKEDYRFVLYLYERLYDKNPLFGLREINDLLARRAAASGEGQRGEELPAL